MNRNAFLDGVRAIAITFVLVGHGVQAAGIHGRVAEVLDLGNLGVRLFFVLSGYLITGILLTEYDRSGRIALGRFYLRRSFRIFPAFYVFLLAMASWQVVSTNGSVGSCAVAAGLYVSNYWGTCDWTLGHTWSLSVEEQFYLLWPATILLAGRLGAMRAALFVIALCPAVRFALNSRPGFSYHFEFVADAMAVGALLAMVGGKIRVSTTAAAFCAVAAVALHLLGTHPSLYGHQVAVYSALAPSVLNALCAVCILCAERGGVAFLALSPLVFVGRLSYSIYLWQQPFLAPDALTVAGVLALPALAYVSYRLVELPMLRVRDRRPSTEDAVVARDRQPRPLHRDLEAGADNARPPMTDG